MQPGLEVIQQAMKAFNAAVDLRHEGYQQLFRAWQALQRIDLQNRCAMASVVFNTTKN